MKNMTTQHMSHLGENIHLQSILQCCLSKFAIHTLILRLKIGADQNCLRYTLTVLKHHVYGNDKQEWHLSKWVLDATGTE